MPCSCHKVIIFISSSQSVLIVLVFNTTIRVTKAPSCSFPFFGKHWTNSSTRPLSAILSTCPLFDDARVIVYSTSAGNFSELIVTADAAFRGDDTLGLHKTSFLDARTYNNVDVVIDSDVNVIEPHVNDCHVASRSCKAPFAHVDIPEIRAAHDTLASCWASRHLASSFILLHGPSGCGKTACMKQVLSKLMIQHEYFDCSAMYAHDGSVFSAAVHNVARQIKPNQSTPPGRDSGAVLILDRLECMFPPLSPHAQVIRLRLIFGIRFSLTVCFSSTNAVNSPFALLLSTN